MDQFIEVTGSGYYSERPVDQWAVITLRVRADENANPAKEVSELREQCLGHLRDAGLKEGEILEGGQQIWQLHERRSKNRSEVSHEIRVFRSDLTPVYRAIEAMEDVFKNQRYSINLATMIGRYEPDLVEQAAAQGAAIREARSNAEAVANESGVKLANMTNAVHIGSRPMGPDSYSGMYGMAMYESAFDVLAGSATPGDSANETVGQLPDSRRQIRVSYRVRFAIKEVNLAQSLEQAS